MEILAKMKKKLIQRWLWMTRWKAIFFLLLINDSVFRLHWKCLNLKWCLFLRYIRYRAQNTVRHWIFFWTIYVSNRSKRKYLVSYIFLFKIHVSQRMQKQTRENQQFLLFLHVAFYFQHILIDGRALIHHKCIMCTECRILDCDLFWMKP